MSELLQEPFTKSVNAHDWRYKDKTLCYIVKNVGCMVGLTRLHPETLQPIGAVLADEAEIFDGGAFRITARLRNMLAVYSEQELEFIKTFSPNAFDTRLVRIISVDEAKQLDGKVITPGATAVTGDL